MSDIRVETLGFMPVPIPDLGVVVQPGQPTWITDAQANASACLSVLTRSRLLRISRGERCRVVQPPKTIHSVTRSRPVTGQAPRIMTPNPAPPPDISRLIQEAVIEGTRRVLAESRPQVIVQPKPELPEQKDLISREDLEALIEKAVTSAIEKQIELRESQAVPEEPVQSRAIGGEEPVYIPSNIVDEQDGAKITVTSSTSSGDDLDGTAQALKNVKRAPRARKKRDSDGEE